MLERALAPDRERRYADAHEMLRDLRVAMRATPSPDSAREHIADVIKRYFDARLEYVRASARGRGIDRTSDRHRSSSVDLGDVAKAAASSASNRSAAAGRTPTSHLSTLAGSSKALREFPEVPTALTQSTPPPRSSRSWSLLLGLPLVGAAVGTAIVSYAQRSNEVEPARVESVEPSAANGGGTTAAVSDEPEIVKWVFNTEPQGATVTIDGRRYDRVTPMTVEMPRGDEPVAVRLEHDGFQPYDATLVPVGPQNHTYRFVALAQPEDRPKTNTNIRFTAPGRTKKPKLKPTGEAPEASGPAVTPPTPPEQPRESGDGRTLAEMPSLKGGRLRPGG